MVLNKHGGKKAKSAASKNQKPVHRNTRLVQEEGEMYAIITKVLGGNHLTVKGIDGKEYMCHIGGKFKKERSSCYDFIMIGLREWQSTSNSKQMTDLLEIYSDIEKKKLLKINGINWNILLDMDDRKTDTKTDTNEEDEGYEFTNDEQSNLEDLINQQIASKNTNILQMETTEEGEEKDENWFNDI
jgi:initiation factor 1A